MKNSQRIENSGNTNKHMNERGQPKHQPNNRKNKVKKMGIHKVKKLIRKNHIIKRAKNSMQSDKKAKYKKK